MDNVASFLDKFNDEEQRSWLSEQLKKKGFNISGNDAAWSNDFLHHTLSEAIKSDVNFIKNIQNNWRQYRFKRQEKSKGVVSRRVSLSKQANAELVSLSRTSKDPINVTVEKLIFDNYRVEIADKRIDKLRQNGIKLSILQAKERAGAHDLLKRKLKSKDGREILAKDLEQANAHIEKHTIANNDLENQLKKLQIKLTEKDKALENLRHRLSAEKRITLELRKEIQ
jgi:hypothetical protein